MSEDTADLKPKPVPITKKVVEAPVETPPISAAIVNMPERPIQKALIARCDFTCSFNGMILKFKTGDFIVDPQHVAHMLSNGLPVRLLNDPVEFQHCPHCQNVFKTQA